MNKNNVRQHWIENIWFNEFMCELENTKGFYSPKYFNNWVQKVTTKIEELKRRRWDIESLGNCVEY